MRGVVITLVLLVVIGGPVIQFKQVFDQDRQTAETAKKRAQWNEHRIALAKEGGDTSRLNAKEIAVVIRKPDGKKTSMQGRIEEELIRARARVITMSEEESSNSRSGNYCAPVTIIATHFPTKHEDESAEALDLEVSEGKYTIGHLSLMEPDKETLATRAVLEVHKILERNATMIPKINA